MNDAALSYARRGWAVIPLHDVASGTCSCGKQCGDAGGKHPINRGWTTGSALSGADISAIWMPDAGGVATRNIGIRTGTISGIFVLDVDPKNGGFEALNIMIAKNGPLPTTFTVRTGSGGAHYYFALPHFEIRNGANKELVRRFGPGIDIRGDGGQVVAPPSVSRIGPYEVITDVEPAPAPDWMLALMQVSLDTTPVGEATVVEDLPAYSELDDFTKARVQRYADAVVDAVVSGYANAAPGTGDNTLFAACCNLLEIVQSPWNLVTVKDVYARLNQARMQRCATHPTGGGQTPEDLLRVFESAKSTVVGRGRPLPPDHTMAGVAFDTPFSAGVAPVFDVQPQVADEDDAELDGYSFGPAKPVTAEPMTSTNPHEVALAAMMAKLMDREAVDQVTPVKPLIKDVLDMESESWIIGAPGGFKSFVALDWAAHVGVGATWMGKKVTQGKVLYLAAEGKKGIPKRIRAWEKQHGRTMENVLVYPEPVQVANQYQWALLVEMCRRMDFALIVLDTQARITVGMNENDAKEMGILIEAVRLLKQAAGACVLVVHHTGRNGQDARGSSALDGAQDVEWRVDRPNGNERTQLTARLSMDKNKDGDEATSFEIKMAVHEVGVDEDGMPITSLAVTAANPFDQPAAKPKPWYDDLPVNQMHVAEVMDIVCDADGQTIPSIRKALKEHGYEVGESSFYAAFNALKKSERVLQGASSARWTLASKLD